VVVGSALVIASSRAIRRTVLNETPNCFAISRAVTFARSNS
jgi:hypothetical protein